MGSSSRTSKRGANPATSSLHEIEADQVITYLEIARERPVNPVSVPWLRSSIAAVRLGLEFHVGVHKCGVGGGASRG